MDLKYAFRQLSKSPGFAAVAVLTLALGIGANTAIFSFINSWILKPSPFPNLDHIVILLETNKRTGATSSVSSADWTDWRQKSEVFEELATAAFDSFNLSGSDEPLKIPGFDVSANFFRTLGIKPALGREFTDAEQIAGQDNVAVLSFELWRDRFSSDPKILGQTITLDGLPTTVVGVMPDNFQYIPMGPAQVFKPLALAPQRLASRDSLFLRPVGRLKPGFDVPRANAAMTALQSSLESAYPVTNTNRGVLVRSLTDEINQQSGNSAVKTLYVIVCFVLLMACANVANLVMARSSARRKEMAIRLAMGAGRWRLIRQLLAETLILFVAGAAGGMLFARWGVAWLYRAIPARSLPYLPNHGHVEVDSQVLLFTLAVTLLTGIAFGLMPALEGTRFDLNGILKDASSRGSSSAAGGRFRKILVGGEMALAVMVVVCGALLVNSFVHMLHTDLGFNGDHVLVAEMQLPPSHKTPASITQFSDSVLERLAPIHGVDRASIAQYTPMSENGSVGIIYFDGRPDPPLGQVPLVRLNAVSPGYLESLSIALIAGRTFSREDSPDATRAIVINQTLVSRYFPGESPLGKRVRLRKDPTLYTVVGVVKDVKYYNPGNPPENQAYVAFAQAPTQNLTIVVRTAGDTSAVAQSIRSVVRGLDPNQPVARIVTIAARVEERTAPDKILTELTGFFGTLALFLAAIGLYGVMAYSVAQRTQEIGVRMALGARSRDVLGLVVRQGMTIVLAGMSVGIVGAIFMARALATYLYGVKAADPTAFITTFLLLASIAFVACWIPARRAARVDPLVALRYE
ncbi:MAG TPA: ABC transporter permease [Bryobacteraceae bacterium]|nr:ABC transporter permease [Bryobacteraceae bacterium]